MYDKLEGRNWVSIAQKADPYGSECYYCKGENDFADDCGWFYNGWFYDIDHEVKEKAICKTCWEKKGSPKNWGDR